MDAEDEQAIRSAGFWPALGTTKLWCRDDQTGLYRQLLQSTDGTWAAGIYAAGSCVRGMPTATAALMAAELTNWGRS